MLSAGARGVVCAVVEHLMIFLSSLPTAKLLVAVLISFLIKEEQTSHFPKAGMRSRVGSFICWDCSGHNLRISIKMLECSTFRGCSSLPCAGSQVWLSPCSLSSPESHKFLPADPGTHGRSQLWGACSESFGLCRQQQGRSVRRFGVLWL